MNDAIIKSARENQTKLGFKSEATVSQVQESEAPKVSIDDVQVEEALMQEMIEDIPPIPEQSLTVEEVIQSPEQVESFVVAEDQLILDEVNAWAESWEAKQLDAYFSHYVDGFSGDMANARFGSYLVNRKSCAVRKSKSCCRKLKSTILKIRFKLFLSRITHQATIRILAARL